MQVKWDTGDSVPAYSRYCLPLPRPSFISALRNTISDRANDAVLAQVLRDPSERDELSASEPAQKRRMMAALAAAQPSVIKTPQIPDDPACCAAAAEKYGGFLGPYVV